MYTALYTYIYKYILKAQYCFKFKKTFMRTLFLFFAVHANTKFVGLKIDMCTYFAEVIGIYIVSKV